MTSFINCPSPALRFEVLLVNKFVVVNFSFGENVRNFVAFESQQIFEFFDNSAIIFDLFFDLARFVVQPQSEKKLSSCKKNCRAAKNLTSCFQFSSQWTFFEMAALVCLCEKYLQYLYQILMLILLRDHYVWSSCKR